MNPRRRRIALKTGAWIAGLFAVYSALGFLAAPPLARAYIEKAATESLGRTVSVGAVGTNPYTLTLRLRDLAVASAQPGAAALSVEAVDVDLGWESLVALAPVVSGLRVVAPRLKVTRLDANRYDWSDVIERLLATPPANPPAQPLRFALSGLSVERGEIDFDDRPDKQRHSVRELSLAVPFVSSLPAFAARDVEPVFSATVDGAPVKLSGTTRPFDDSRHTALAFDIGRLDLVRYADYIPIPLRVRLASGAVRGHVDLAFSREKDRSSALVLKGRLLFENMDIRHASGAQLLSVARLDLNVASLDLLARALVLQEVRAAGADVRLARDRSGRLSLASLAGDDARRDAKQAGGASPFAVEVRELHVAGSRIVFADDAASPPFKWIAEEVDASVSNLANHDDRRAEVQISFRTPGGESARASAGLSLAPLSAQGRFELKGFGITRYAPYYSSFLAADIEQGSLSASGAFVYSTGAAGKAAELRFNDVAARIADFKLSKSRTELIRAAELEVSGGQLDVERRTLAVGALAARKGRIAPARDASGAVNFMQLAPATAVPATAAPARPWSVSVGKLSLEGLELGWEDVTTPVPAKLALGVLSVSAQNISTQANSRGSLNAALQAGQGRISLSGPVQLDPPSAALQLEARDFEVVPFQPYIAGLLNIGLRNGAAGARGTLTVEGSAVSYAGELSIDGVSAIGQPGGEEVFGWKSLALRAVKAKASPFELNAGELALGDFHTRLVVLPEGRFNLQDLLVRAPQRKPETRDGETPREPASSGAAGRAVRIDRLLLKGGTIDFADRYIKPSYSAHITGLGGTVSGLSGDPGTRAEIQLKGQLEGAPVEIDGNINPFADDLALDVKASVRGYDLNLISPYAAKYVGYGIERGKLALDVQYRLENRRLEARNQIVLNQLVFGVPVESPDAIKAPVLLAVRLLQNSRGEINVDLPISGSLDDPQFNVGALVVRIIGNLIVRAVSAPFALLGSAFGGGGEELAWIEFEPGRSALNAAARAKLNTLAKALADRPALTLEIAGRADPRLDADALKRAAPEKMSAAPVAEDELRALANRRAAELRDALSKSGVAPDRMFLANPRREEGEGRQQASPARADLYLH
jgi:uncharacterized protein involved in outer membrane biogenesis